jgi:hypothetical protein
MGKRTLVPEGKQRVRVGEGIYLKSSGKYLATFRNPGGKQQWAEFRTKREAQDWRIKGKADPRSVLSGDAPSMKYGVTSSCTTAPISGQRRSRTGSRSGGSTSNPSWRPGQLE